MYAGVRSSRRRTAGSFRLWTAGTALAADAARTSRERRYVEEEEQTRRTAPLNPDDLQQIDDIVNDKEPEPEPEPLPDRERRSSRRGSAGSSRGSRSGKDEGLGATSPPKTPETPGGSAKKRGWFSSRGSKGDPQSPEVLADGAASPKDRPASPGTPAKDERPGTPAKDEPKGERPGTAGSARGDRPTTPAAEAKAPD